MNTLIISWRAYKSDGRLEELVKCFMQLGEVFLFSSDTSSLFEHHQCFKTKSYFSFVREAVKYGKRLKNIDAVVIDDRRPIIPACIVKRKAHIPKMIIDCRETYFFKDVDHFSGKIGCLIEKPAIKKADIVIAANKERAEIMKNRYRLKDTPISFENVRRLEYSADYDEQTVKKNLIILLILMILLYLHHLGVAH